MKRRIDGKQNGDPHLVPLPTQAVEILRKLHPVTGHGVMVFPGERSHERPISDNTLRAALLTLGYGPTVQTVHGFRAMARTLLAEGLVRHRAMPSACRGGTATQSLWALRRAA